MVQITSEPIRPIGMLRLGLTVSSDAVETAGRQEGLEILALHGRQRYDNERGQGGDLDRDQHCIDLGGFGCADHQQPGDHQRDQASQQIECTTVVRSGAQRHRQGQGAWFNQTEQIGVDQESVHVAGPAHRHRACGDCVFKHQCPTDDPGQSFAKYAVGVGVGRTGYRHHGGKFCVGQRGKRAHHGRNHERNHHARAGLLPSFRGQHENARADHRANTEHGQLECTQLTGQRLLAGCFKNLVERFDAPKKHRDLPEW